MAPKERPMTCVSRMVSSAAGALEAKFYQPAMYAALVEQERRERSAKVRLLFLEDGVAAGRPVDDAMIASARAEAARVWGEVHRADESGGGRPRRRSSALGARASRTAPPTTTPRIQARGGRDLSPSATPPRRGLAPKAGPL